MTARTTSLVPYNGFPLKETERLTEKLLTGFDPEDMVARLNSGKTFTFVKETNAFSGQPGWRPKEIPNFDPVAPSMVLHDIWEHSPGSPATPDEEFQAIGSAMLLRFEGGYFAKKSERPSDALAPAFGMLFFHAQVKNRRPTRECPYYIPAASAPLENGETELEMVRAIGKARDFIQGNGLFNLRRKEIDLSLVQALGWMRIGYRKATLRFAGIRLPRLANTYLQAEKQIAEFLTIDDGELSVTVHPELYIVKVQHQRERTFSAGI
jgi:hypothetical protein